MENERERRLRKLDEEYGAYTRGAVGVPFYHNNAAWRYVLVEESRYSKGDFYLTMHPTLDDAASYHDSQEYPEDWDIRFLVDVKRGWRYTAFTTTAFVLNNEEE